MSPPHLRARRRHRSQRDEIGADAEFDPAVTRRILARIGTDKPRSANSAPSGQFIVNRRGRRATVRESRVTRAHAARRTTPRNRRPHRRGPRRGCADASPVGVEIAPQHTSQPERRERHPTRPARIGVPLLEDHRIESIHDAQLRSRRGGSRCRRCAVHGSGSTRCRGGRRCRRAIEEPVPYRVGERRRFRARSRRCGSRLPSGPSLVEQRMEHRTLVGELVVEAADADAGRVEDVAREAAPPRTPCRRTPARPDRGCVRECGSRGPASVV